MNKYRSNNNLNLKLYPEIKKQSSCKQMQNEVETLEGCLHSPDNMYKYNKS